MYGQNLFGLLCFFFPSSPTKPGVSAPRLELALYCMRKMFQFMLLQEKSCKHSTFHPNSWLDSVRVIITISSFWTARLLIFLWTLEMLSLAKGEKLRRYSTIGAGKGVLFLFWCTPKDRLLPVIPDLLPTSTVSCMLVD